MVAHGTQGAPSSTRARSDRVGSAAVKHSTPASDVRDLVRLGRDHPGFSDPAYRSRRDTIAAIALAHLWGETVPEAPYTEDEHAVWRLVNRLLAPLHQQHVCRELLEMQVAFPLDRQRIPQLADVNQRLQRHTGMRMEPVTGLVNARTFLAYMGRGIFLSTQYIRHHSRPLYTPEPDVVHELVGHAASLAHPGLAGVNRLMGRAAADATETEMQRLEYVYWYVLEFGLVRENGDIKAVGAGLLSSAGELAAAPTEPEHRDWDLDAIARTPYDPTCMQPALFVAPSFDRMITDLTTWTESGAWRDASSGLSRRVPSSMPAPLD